MERRGNTAMDYPMNRNLRIIFGVEGLSDVILCSIDENGVDIFLRTLSSRRKGCRTRQCNVCIISSLFEIF